MQSISRKTQVKRGFEKLQPSTQPHWTKNLAAARNVRRHYLHDHTEEYKFIRKSSQMKLTYQKWVISTLCSSQCFSQSLGPCFCIKDWGSWKPPSPAWQQALTTALNQHRVLLSISLLQILRLKNHMHRIKLSDTTEIYLKIMPSPSLEFIWW